MAQRRYERLANSRHNYKVESRRDIRNFLVRRLVLYVGQYPFVAQSDATLVLDAMSSSCVAMMMVTPERWCRSCGRIMNSLALSELRFPVGSSAMITSSRLARARAIATSCCSSPVVRSESFAKQSDKFLVVD